jgi:hypothetical protein
MAIFRGAYTTQIAPLHLGNHQGQLVTTFRGVNRCLCSYKEHTIVNLTAQDRDGLKTSVQDRKYNTPNSISKAGHQNPHKDKTR